MGRELFEVAGVLRAVGVHGGDHEDRPAAIDNVITDQKNGKATLKTPGKPGAYRLFVYITDGNKKVATANIPFYVRE